PLVRAAEARGIPWLRLNDQSLIQLGYGKYQQRIRATVTGRTPHIAVELDSDKEETNKILASLGLPVPEQELVQSESQAVRAARRIGFPVVTKPYNGNHGRGISIRLTTDEEVAHGFNVAREHSRSVVVESFLEGDDHRLLVGICEINAAPGFRMHVAPSEGAPRDVAAPVIEMLFPPGAPSRVPIAAVTGTNGKTTTTRMLAHITKMAGFTPGLTTTDGVYIDGQRTVAGDMTGPVSARMVLAAPQIDIAGLETARGGLLRAGMGGNQANVARGLNVHSDHLGLKGIDTLEQLAEVKRVVVEVATDCAVLN